MAKRNKPAQAAQAAQAPEIELKPDLKVAIESKLDAAQDLEPETHPAIEIARACQTGAGAPLEIPGARYVLPAPPVIKPSR